MCKKSSSFLALLVAAILVMNLPQTIRVTASTVTASTATIYTKPLSILFTPSNGTVGTFFNVSIWVKDVTDLCGFQIQIRFNQTIIDCVDAIEPTTDPNYVLHSIVPNTMITKDDKPGQYTVGGSELPGRTPAHFNGTGLITIFKFKITAAPGQGESLACILNINNDQTFALDGNGIVIDPMVIEDGYYEFKGQELPPPPPGGARLFVDPPEIINSTIRPCMTFFINISVAEVQDMHSCEFNLSYNTEILSWVGVSMLRVDGKLPFPAIDADDEGGYIWIKLVYPINVTTTDPIPLVKIEFHVDAMGASPLDLHDTKLLDPYDRSIDHQEQDGFFMTEIRDVAILNVVPSNNWTYPERLFNITVIAGNLGNVNETLEVKVYYDTHLIDTKTVNLTASSNTTLVFTWNTKLVEPCHKYTISAKVTPVPYELNLINNNYTDGLVKVYYLGDVNRDGIVNMQDIYTLVLAFLAEPGDPRWNPDIDVIQDNIINMMDIYKAMLNFQKSCPD